MPISLLQKLNTSQNYALLWSCSSFPPISSSNNERNANSLPNPLWRTYFLTRGLNKPRFLESLINPLFYKCVLGDQEQVGVIIWSSTWRETDTVSQTLRLHAAKLRIRGLWNPSEHLGGQTVHCLWFCYIQSLTLDLNTWGVVWIFIF